MDEDEQCAGCGLPLDECEDVAEDFVSGEPMCGECREM